MHRSEKFLSCFLKTQDHLAGISFDLCHGSSMYRSETLKMDKLHLIFAVCMSEAEDP